jgi:hypothetical protein
MNDEDDERSERYLVDGAGPPDPETARLEHLLARYRHRPAPLAAEEPEKQGFLVRPRWIQLALATAAAFVVLMLLVRQALPERGWVVRADGGPGRLLRGEWLRAGEGGAELEVAGLGRVELRPGAHVRLDDDGDERQALFLEQGGLRAFITAEPRAFQVGTPAGLSIDLGCLYDLEVDAGGAARLYVETGQVAFEAEGRTVFVPAGYATRSEPGRGPLVPLEEGTETGVVELVRRVEASASPDGADLARVGELGDSVVLYHLLRAPSRAVRESALDALLKLEQLPEGVARESVLADEPVWRAWHDELSWRPAWRG